MSKETPENLELTPASEIRKRSEKRNKGKPTKLPSGAVVLLRKPDVGTMLLKGEVPSELVSIAMEMGDVGSSPKSIEKGIQFMNLLIKSSLVSPKVVEENPQDDEILITDLTEEDRNFILGFAQEGVEQVKPFREEGEQEDSSGHSSEEIPKQKTE